LRRAVSFASFGKLRFKTEYEQEIWSECSRLIANCIIFYNASILSQFLEHKERTGDTQGADEAKRSPPSPGRTSTSTGAMSSRSSQTP
jgi:Tn3 transposase DDE domain-containing protein